MSTQSRTGGGSRASDDDTKTAVKVGEYTYTAFGHPSVMWHSFACHCCCSGNRILTLPFS